MRGSFAMLSAKEHYGMLFAPFCPYHAHVGHAGECPKWRNTIRARQAARSRLAEEAAAKSAMRGRQYADAASSSRSDARF